MRTKNKGVGVGAMNAWSWLGYGEFGHSLYSAILLGVKEGWVFILLQNKKCVILILTCAKN